MHRNNHKDESSVTGIDHDGASCSCCVETSSTFSQVQDFSDDPALGAGRLCFQEYPKIYCRYVSKCFLNSDGSFF